MKISIKNILNLKCAFRSRNDITTVLECRENDKKVCEVGRGLFSFDVWFFVCFLDFVFFYFFCECVDYVNCVCAFVDRLFLFEFYLYTLVIVNACDF